MSINVFFHKIEDVDYFFTRLFDTKENYDFYVTHAGVMEYCMHTYKVQAVLISSLFSELQIEQIVQSCQNQTYTLLQELDVQYSKQLSNFVDSQEINFFFWLYSYHLPFVLEGLFVFEEAIQQLGLDKKNIIFDYSESFYNIFDLKSYLDFTLNDKKINIDIQWHETQRVALKESKINLVQIVITQPKKVLSRIFEYIIELKAYLSKGKTILFMENLYDLRFIKSKSFRLIPYSYNALQHKFAKKRVYSKIPSIENLFSTHNSDGTKVEYIQLKIINHFKISWKIYYTGLKNLGELLRKNTVDAAVWGNPPVFKFKALFYAYLKSKNIPIVGMQHGASYVDQKYSNHFYSDFMRCNYFISYGFTQTDYDNIFNKYNPPELKIISCGSTKKTIENDSKKQIDVLFPVTNTISLLDGGFCRVKPDILHFEQKQILNLLESKAMSSKLNVLIKPMMDTNLWQTSIYLELKILTHCKVTFKQSLVEVLNKVQPKCVIIEFMSTPLYEVLPLDIEIFLLIHQADNLTPQAKIMLEKRVHLCMSYEELEEKFLLWSHEKLMSKRDDTYYNYYVHKPYARENIQKFLEEL